jgi:hypothetical protein
MNRISLFLVLVGLLSGACNLPQRSIGSTAEPTDTTRPPEPPLSGVPTVEPTLATLQLAVHPPGARTGIEELDRFIDAVLSHDAGTLRSLTDYQTLGCTHAEGLGGPPKCTPQETEGEAVDAVPFLGPEGHFMRRAEFEQWPGPDVLGLLVAYQVGPGAYSEQGYPAGTYALAFLDANSQTVITLQVRNGQVVRYDYRPGGSIRADLERDAASFLIPLEFNPIPTLVPWTPFEDPQGRFSFVYPPTMTLTAGRSSNAWRLGDRIEVTLQGPGASFSACFDQALGDCPIVQDDRTVTINGSEARRVKGYIGAVGGMVPQEFLTYVFTVGSEKLVFTLYALPFDTKSVDIQQIWPLPGFELELFERTISTVTLQPQ